MEWKGQEKSSMLIYCVIYLQLVFINMGFAACKQTLLQHAYGEYRRGNKSARWRCKRKKWEDVYIRKKWQNHQPYKVTWPRTLASGRCDLHRPIRSTAGKQSASWPQEELHSRLICFENSCSWWRAGVLSSPVLVTWGCCCCYELNSERYFLSLGWSADPSLLLVSSPLSYWKEQPVPALLWKVNFLL